jgi:hypothetical protein
VIRVCNSREHGGELSRTQADEIFDELAQEQYALTGFRMHPHHRMFRLVVVGDELLAG